MKKKFSLFVAMIITFFSVAYADTEIIFLNIQWLSNEETVYNDLVEAGFVRSSVNMPDLLDDDPRFINSNSGFYTPDIIVGVENYAFCMDLKQVIKGKIAGYPINNLKLSFAYDGLYQLLSVTVDLLGATFEDLKTKLTKVYGEGEQTITDEGIESVIWKGANNTGVLLYTQSEGLDYTLMYGRLDAEEILSSCMKTDPDDVTGL